MGAVTRRCRECGEPARIVIKSVPCSNRYYRKNVMMKIKCQVVRAWVCDLGHAENAGTLFPPTVVIRPEIVEAIRRHKAAGWRYFAWEKQ